MISHAPAYTRDIYDVKDCERTLSRPMAYRSSAMLADMVHSADRETKKHMREMQKEIRRPGVDDAARCDMVLRKYADLFNDMKRTQRELEQAKKNSEAVQKEKDTAKTDLTKMTTTKEKLEKLCREMQKDNKKLKVCHCCAGSNGNL